MYVCVCTSRSRATFHIIWTKKINIYKGFCVCVHISASGRKDTPIAEIILYTYSFKEILRFLLHCFFYFLKRTMKKYSFFKNWFFIITSRALYFKISFFLITKKKKKFQNDEGISCFSPSPPRDIIGPQHICTWRGRRLFYTTRAIHGENYCLHPPQI